MIAPVDDSVYEPAPLDSELAGNQSFARLRNNPPTFSMTKKRKVYVASDSFGCQGNTKAKTSFDVRMQQRFNDWASGYGIEIEYCIIPGATCKEIHEMITQTIKDDPDAKGESKSFEHLIFICGMGK